jgi:hypothetical protein
MNKSTILLIPEKTDIEFDQVIDAWEKLGGQVKRLGKYWIKDDELATQRIAIYGSQAFALVLAQIYDVVLLSPDDTLIVRLDNKWTKRDIQMKQVGLMNETNFPVFIKPVIPKMFMAGVFINLSAFKDATAVLPNTEAILVSTIIEDIQAEARCYLMNGEVKDIAFYEGSADLEEGRNFVAEFAVTNKSYLPEVVVVDIAFSQQTGWFVLEFNACWGAGLNNCNAEKVIDCIIGATVNGSMNNLA